MQQLKAWLLPKVRWKRALLVFGLGLFSGLAFAPTYILPAWPLAFGVTAALLYQTPGWRGRLWLAFLFGPKIVSRQFGDSSFDGDVVRQNLVNKLAYVISQRR